jgi:hypothetical protein
LVQLVFRASATTSTSGEGKKVQVKPGETAHVKVGGTGRPVAGKIGVSSDERLKGGKIGQITMMSKFEMPEWVRPLEVMQMSRQDAMAWEEKWRQTAEGKNVDAEVSKVLNAIHHYNAVVKADGTFRIDDIAPGTYWLLMSLEQPKSGNGSAGYQAPVGGVRREVRVVEVAGGVTDDALDLGVLTPEYMGELKVGDVVPELKADGADGKAIAVGDYRGKYLLLEIWGTQNRELLPSPVVDEVWQKYKQDARIAILGVSFDRLSGGGKKYAQAKGITWPMAQISGNSNIFQLFPAAGQNSAAWLIGPDGKVVAANLRGEEMKAAVEKVLGK